MGSRLPSLAGMDLPDAVCVGQRPRGREGTIAAGSAPGGSGRSGRSSSCDDNCDGYRCRSRYDYDHGKLVGQQHHRYSDDYGHGSRSGARRGCWLIDQLLRTTSPGASLLAVEFGDHRAGQGRPATPPVPRAGQAAGRLNVLQGADRVALSPRTPPLRPYRLGVGAAALLVVVAVRPVADRPIDYRTPRRNCGAVRPSCAVSPPAVVRERQVPVRLREAV